MTRVKVLHIVTWMGVGGAERLVLMAATGLPPAIFESAICTFVDRGPFADAAERAGVRVWCLGAFPSLRHPAALLRLYRIIRTFRPDVVHTHLQAPSLYGRLIAWIARVPVIVATEHNVYEAKAPRHQWIERMLAPRTTALVAVSEQVRQFLAAQLRIAPSAIRLLRNGVDEPIASPARVDALRREWATAASPIIGTVASLTPKKGHVFLLQAIAMLRERGVDCICLLAGEGAERAAIEAQAASMGIADRVRCVGVQTSVADFIALLDVFVLPSLVEGLPLALLEAMAMGKAVIATAVGGVPEVVTSSVNGVLVPARQPEALADALQRLLGDAGLRADYGARARETVREGFTAAVHLDALASLYLTLLNRAVPMAASH